MKTLIINGSPRKDGDTVSLVNIMKEILEGEILEISAYYDKISPCTDCRYCQEHKECCIKDKMELIYGDDFDNLIVASPIYMSGLPGPLISLASRLQLYYVLEHLFEKKELKAKNGGIILVGGGDGTPKRAISYASYILNELNATLTDEDIVLSLNTNIVPAIEDKEAVEKVKKLALKLNETGLLKNIREQTTL